MRNAYRLRNEIRAQVATMPQTATTAARRQRMRPVQPAATTRDQVNAIFTQRDGCIRSI